MHRKFFGELNVWTPAHRHSTEFWGYPYSPGEGYCAEPDAQAKYRLRWGLKAPTDKPTNTVVHQRESRVPSSAELSSLSAGVWLEDGDRVRLLCRCPIHPLVAA